MTDIKPIVVPLVGLLVGFDTLGYKTYMPQVHKLVFKKKHKVKNKDGMSYKNYSQ